MRGAGDVYGLTTLGPVKARNAQRALEDDGAAEEYDPIADLLFSLVAVLLIVILAELPGIAASTPRGAPDFLQAQVRYQGAPAIPVLAAAEGLRLPPSGRTIALDSIIGDADVRRFLEKAANDHMTIMEVVLPGGSEAAFELENLLATYDPAPIAQVRLGRACRFETAAGAFDLCAPSDAAKEATHG